MRSTPRATRKRATSSATLRAGLAAGVAAGLASGMAGVLDVMNRLHRGGLLRWDFEVKDEAKVVAADDECRRPGRTFKLPKLRDMPG